MAVAKNNEPYFTPADYFVWEAKQLERHELINGQVYAMSGGTKNHSTIKLNIASLLKTHLRGSSCRVFNSDLKVNILHTQNYTYPDVSVTCDERDREHPLYIAYPCLIVEVLSESTEAYDRGKKFEKYRRNPQLQDYVLVSSEEISVDIYHKNTVGEWVILSYREGDRVEFKSLNFRVAIEAFYEEVIFEQSPGEIINE